MFLGSVEILLPSIFLYFKRGYEGDPLSPPDGEATQGEHPLDPLYFSSLPKKNFSPAL
jgi:hypothetical protein